jgi:hypothetical protein
MQAGKFTEKCARLSQVDLWFIHSLNNFANHRTNRHRWRGDYTKSILRVESPPFAPTTANPSCVNFHSFSLNLNACMSSFLSFFPHFLPQCIKANETRQHNTKQNFQRALPVPHNDSCNDTGMGFIYQPKKLF